MCETTHFANKLITGSMSLQNKCLFCRLSQCVPILQNARLVCRLGRFAHKA